MGDDELTSGAERQRDPPPDSAIAIGAIQIATRGPVVEMAFPPLRAAASALMLAAFGTACPVIGTTAILGLSGSDGSTAGSLLALAFAGVFALPLTGLGVAFIGVAVWTAANSLTVEVSHAGVRTQRRCCGVPVLHRWIPRSDLVALDARLAAKYVGVFGSTRYYCLYARSRGRATLIADSLQGPDVANHVRNMMTNQLGLPELATRSNDIPATDASD